MPSSLPASFNPHGDHPFTNHAKGAMPAPPSPSKYPKEYRRRTSPLVNHRNHRRFRLVPSCSASSTSSSSSSKGIFTPYRPDGRGTPDLEDILSAKKKPTWNKK
ncbi:hypothetical protein BGW80DRAFT_1456598 [Lactifluus volemus]|nr:hypothetical protein BGW80DRAFT_1456598 [Lactifluus volemus]